MSGAKNKKSLLVRVSHGLVAAGAGNDPSGIATYSIMGAVWGLSQLWLLVWSIPLQAILLALCAKFGDLKKKGLAKLIAANFPKKAAVLLTLLLFLGNLATLSADISAMGAALKILYPFANYNFLLIGCLLFLWLVIVIGNFKLMSRVFLPLSLVSLCYFFSALLVRPDWIAVIKASVVPFFPADVSYWVTALAFLGTTISPFIFYWEVTQEAEDHPSVRDVEKELKEVFPGTLFANIIAAFMIITSAFTLYPLGLKIETADQAAIALTPLLGAMATTIFAVGILGAGFLSVPILSATSAYAVSESLGWVGGLDKKFLQAFGFYFILTLSLLLGLLLPLLGVNAIKAMFYSQALNGILTPIFIFVIWKLAKKIGLGRV